MEAPQIIYLVVAAATAFMLSRTASHRYPVFVMLVWLLCFPVTDSEKTVIRMSAFNMDLTVERMALVLLLPFCLKLLVLADRSGEYRRSSRGLLPWLVAYSVAAEGALYYNVSNLGWRYVISMGGKFLLCIIFVWLACTLCDARDRQAIQRGVVALACYSAVVALVQWKVDDSFLRLGVANPLSSGVNRAKGLFDEISTQGVVLSIAVALVMLSFRKVSIKVALTALLSAGVAVSLLRVNWIIFLLVLLTCLSFTRQVRLMLGLTCAVLAAAWVGLASSQEWILKDIKRDRASTVNVEGRIALMKLAVQIIPAHPLGIGNFFDSPNYAQEVSAAGIGFYDMPMPKGGSRSVPYAIHNGFLAAFVKYGFAGGLCFVGLCGQALIVLIRNVTGAQGIKLFGLRVWGVFVIGNISQENSYPYIPFCLTWLLIGTEVAELQRAAAQKARFPTRSSPMVGAGRMDSAWP